MRYRPLLLASLLLVASCQTIIIRPDDRTPPNLRGSFGEADRLRPTYGSGWPVPHQFDIGREIYISVATENEAVGFVVIAEDLESGIASLEAPAQVHFNCSRLPGAPRRSIDFPASYFAPPPTDRRAWPSRMVGTIFTIGMLRERGCEGGPIDAVSIWINARASNHLGVSTGLRRSIVTIIRE